MIMELFISCGNDDGWFHAILMESLYHSLSPLSPWTVLHYGPWEYLSPKLFSRIGPYACDDVGGGELHETSTVNKFIKFSDVFYLLMVLGE
ncbi:hypothetical protein Pmani_034501 [Petrolisthes manimaculis]|uniref:Uncharacterized protein n=1 Tax=Petrolisthes manimaculis TaxID=1843537 RepID=A0AAE1NP77_9EUCA|nr:hypothetical protein Pmani_034501 [Petrolisthes manimaculis]